MKGKDIFIVTILCVLVLGIYFLNFNNKNNDNIYDIYNVYLNGKIIGKIDNKDELYALIDQKQQSIKDKYNVKNVYPPSDLQIVETYTYDNTLNNIEEIYNKIEEEQDFTIPGYEVSVSLNGEEKFKINLLNKDILDEAVREFIYAFVDKEDFLDYIDGSSSSLEDAGYSYSDMDILENITIKEKYISVNDKIYENSEELAQDLLFGFNYEKKSYTVKEGDTIESISENNDPPLNTQEFLVANPKFTSKDSLLTVGEEVNITLINPELSLSYVMHELKEVEEPYDKKIVRDNTKDPNFSEITTPGVTGLALQRSHYNVVNGEPSNEVVIEEYKVIRQKVDQVTTRGVSRPQFSTQTYEGVGSGWKWPTNTPYMVTSEFAPRWGKYHNGLDISGTGRGSNIYAANDGLVVYVFTGCDNEGHYGSKCGDSYGNHVIISHGDNIYTLYAHMLSNIPVKINQEVKQGQIIGYMGSSGSSTGVHLHFGLSVGMPLRGGTFRNPRELFR